MTKETALTSLSSQSARQLMSSMYGADAVDANLERYRMVAEGFESSFGKKEFEYFTAPGRTEIGGNHTDHNQGKIVAGSVQMDCVAAAAANENDTITIISENYHAEFVIDLNHLEPTKETTGSLPLIRGVLAGLRERGMKLGGFDAYVTSNVISGSGVSSSASFEMLICVIVDYFYNGYQRDVVTYAKAGQYAENRYWLKGSGLLDQMACAVGGIITIDFKDSLNPKIKKVDIDFNELGLDLVIVATGKGHADLSAEYSSIPNEMKSVAKYFGKEVLCEISEEMVIDHVQEIRRECGDRAFLRAIHFFEENKKVDQQVAALEAKDKKAFLSLIKESGNSSFKWLQNCYLNDAPKEQGISSALALTEVFLEDIPDSASRVHGGGFAGVIAVFTPTDKTDEYCAKINKALGAGSAFKMHIRNQGAIRVEL